MTHIIIVVFAEKKMTDIIQGRAAGVIISF